MPRIIIAALALAASLTGAAPAWAQMTYQPRVSFDIAGAHYSLAAPPGYCRATGAMDADFRKYEAGADSELLFALVPCGPNADRADYFLIKHASNFDGPGRAALLKQLAGEFPVYDVSKSNREVSADVGEEMSQTVGGKVDLAVDIRPRGIDSVCGYMGGSVAFTRAGRTGIVALAACVTAAGPRAMFVFRYLPATDTARLKGMFSEDHAIAESLRTE